MTGLLASVDLTTPGQPINVYTVAADTLATITLNIVNRNSTSNVKVRIALSTGTSPALGDWIEYDQSIYPNEKYIQPGIVLSSGQRLFVQTDTTSVGASVWGIEEGILS